MEPSSSFIAAISKRLPASAPCGPRRATYSPYFGALKFLPWRAEPMTTPTANFAVTGDLNRLLVEKVLARERVVARVYYTIRNGRRSPVYYAYFPDGLTSLWGLELVPDTEDVEVGRERWIYDAEDDLEDAIEDALHQWAEVRFGVAPEFDIELV